MDLINKIQVLRRQMLALNATVFQQRQALDEANMLYESLKEFMTKLPSYKVAEELNEVKHNLFVKNRKLKALIAEVNAKDSDHKSKDAVVDNLKMDLARTKTELCNEKKKKVQLLEERQILAQMQAHCFSAPPNFQRTLGAGFKIPN